jgi:hypothetical protein
MPDSKHWYWEFVVKDWLVDTGPLLELTRSFWHEALCRMWLLDRCGQLCGSYAELAKLCRSTPNNARAAIADLLTWDTADIQIDGEYVTLTNRRMRRDYLDRKSLSERVARHRARKVKREGNGQCNDDVTPTSYPQPKPQEKEGVVRESRDKEKFPSGFLEFWGVYPAAGRDRSSRKKAYAVWQKNKLEARANEVLCVLERWKRTPTWTKEAGQFVMAVDRWLREEKYDEPPALPQSRATQPPRLYKPTVDVSATQRSEQVATDYLAKLEPIRQFKLIEEFKQAVPLYANREVKLESPGFLAWLYEQIQKGRAA